MPREVLIDDNEAKEQVLSSSPKQEGMQEQAAKLEENRERERETGWDWFLRTGLLCYA
jgi:hypothetical protein